MAAEEPTHSIPSAEGEQPRSPGVVCAQGDPCSPQKPPSPTSDSASQGAPKQQSHGCDAEGQDSGREGQGAGPSSKTPSRSQSEVADKYMDLANDDDKSRSQSRSYERGGEGSPGHAVSREGARVQLPWQMFAPRQSSGDYATIRGTEEPIMGRLPTPSRSPKRRSIPSSRECSPTNGGSSPFGGGSPTSPGAPKLGCNMSCSGPSLLTSSSSKPFLGASMKTEVTDVSGSPDPAIPAAARESKFWMQFRLALSLLGLFFVLLGTVSALVGLGVPARRPIPEPAPPRLPPRVGPLTTRSLFESTELHDAATDNLMRVGHRFLNPGDRNMVWHVVAESFTALSQHITSSQTAVLRDEDKDAAVQAMELMSDPRVQGLGLEVAWAIRKSRQDFPESTRRVIQQQDILAQVTKRLEPRTQEIRALQAELVPAALHRLRKGHRWSLTFDPSTIRVAETISGRWDIELGVQNAAAKNSEDMTIVRRLRGGQKSLPVDHKYVTPNMPDSVVGIVAGVLEQARFLLDVVNPQLDGTPVAQYVSRLGISTRLLIDCKVESNKRLLGAVVCPLKFGSLGLDVL